MPPYDVQLIRAVSVPLAVVRRTVSASGLATVVPECCGQVWTFLRSHHLKGGRHVAIYWNGDIRLEVGVEVSDSLPPDSEVVASATPAGLTASVVHFGPYAQLGAAHQAIRRWCSESGYRVVGPNWEVYGHWQNKWDANPSHIRTDVFYQVAPDNARSGA